MTKQNRDNQLEQFDHLTFTRALDLVEGWAALSASEEELDRLGSLLVDRPDAYRPLFAEVNKFAASLVLSLHNARAWDNVDSETLALLVCGGEAVRIGARNCAPASLALPSIKHQLSLYLILLHSRAMNLGVDSRLWVRHVVTLWALGPRGMREVAQRCVQHVGVGYGLAAHLWNQPEAEEELRDVLKKIQWLSDKYLSENAQQAVKARLEAKDSIVPELGSALGRVLEQRELFSDPLHGLLKALDGKLNVFPKAVANQLTKDLKPLRRYRTIEIEITAAEATSTHDGAAHLPDDLSQLPDLDQLSALDELLEQEELGERERLVARISVEVTRLCAKSAKHRVGYAAFLGEQSKVELAAQHRKDPDTIARWERAFLAALKDCLRASASPSQ